MKKIALIAVAALCLAFPALAVAKTNKVSGGVVGDQNSKIKAKVVVSGKEPKKVKGFKAKNIDIRCNGEVIDEGFNFTVTGTLSVNKKGSFKARLPNNENPKEKLRVSGVVKNNGKSISGNIKTNQLTLSGQDCDMPKQHFELKK